MRRGFPIAWPAAWLAASLLVLGLMPIAAAAAPASIEATGRSSTPEHATLQEGQAEPAGEEHPEEEKPWWEWPARWINFALLSALLYWVLVVPPPAIQNIFTYPGLKVILAERSASIIEARDLAGQQQEEAARLLTESEQRLGRIEEEVTTLIDEARGDAEREKERAEVEGKEQAERAAELTQRELRAERIAAQRQLRVFVADLAVGMAEGNLREHLTADDQDRLIREYLSRIGESMA